MKIEITKAFGSYSAGEVLPDVPGNIARTWIGRGIAREVTAVVPASPVDRMVRPVLDRIARRPQSGAA